VKNQKRLVGFTVLILLFFSTIGNVFAQAKPDIRVNTITTIELPDSVNLKVYFNLFDQQTGKAITDAIPESAMITLLNNGMTSPGEIKQPDVPIYITMVLDASGSMAGAQALLQEAAKLALNNVPNNAFFSVVQFDEEIVLLQDFTENQAAISYAIDQLKVTGRGTCLYDAAFTAVEAMEKAPVGRRAVILFTDGKDETAAGKICSQHTYRELVDKAMKAQVPINTIGLSINAGNINSLELENMAASTGGFSAIGNQSQLRESFEQIMAGLKAQWMVEASVYPRQGDNNAVLTVMLKDVGEINNAFIIPSSKEYPGPPSPVTAKLEGFTLKPESMTYDIQLSVTSPDLVQYLRLSIWEQKGGSKITEFVFEQLADFNTLKIPTDALTPGKEYEMRIVLTDKVNNFPFVIARDDQGKAFTELIHGFTFDPSGVLPKVNIQSVIQSGDDLVIQISTSNPLLVKGYDGWLINEETKTVVPNSTFTSGALPNGAGSITIPMKAAKIVSGKYTIRLRALGLGGEEMSAFEYPGVVYTVKKVSLFSKIFTALNASPIFFYIILAIILIVIAFLMIYNWREKSLTGTPVMQGRLGRSVNKRKGQNISPFAQDEPAGRINPVKSPDYYTPQKPSSQYYGPQKGYSSQSDQLIPADQLDKTIIDIPNSMDATLIAPFEEKTPSLVVIRMPSTAYPPGYRIAVQHLPFTIGRENASLTLNAKSVSRLHAEILRDPGSGIYMIRDLNSSNGTLVDGNQLKAQHPVVITNGSRIRLGPDIEIAFEQQ
jgi:VWFA-related protein